jgi:hypothetical protein
MRGEWWGGTCFDGFSYCRTSVRKDSLLLNREGIEIIEVGKEPLPQVIEKVIKRIKERKDV